MIMQAACLQKSSSNLSIRNSDLGKETDFVGLLGIYSEDVIEVRKFL